jgi:hypothetical protein
MLTQPKTTQAPTRSPRRAAKSPRRRVVELHANAWFDLFDHDSWPDQPTTVETLAAAIRAAG